MKRANKFIFTYLDKYYFLVHLANSFNNYEFWYVMSLQRTWSIICWDSAFGQLHKAYEILSRTIRKKNWAEFLESYLNIQLNLGWVPCDNPLSCFKKLLGLLTSFQNTRLENGRKFLFPISLNQVLYATTEQKPHFSESTLLLAIVHLLHSQLKHRQQRTCYVFSCNACSINKC